MTLARKPGAGLISNGSSWQVDYGANAGQAAAGTLLPGPYPIDTTGATNGQGLTFNGVKYVAGAAGGVSPFLFRLNPLITTQFGTERHDGGTAGTVTAMTDTTGRPFIRMAVTDGNIHVFPLIAGGTPISATGRFQIRALLRPNPNASAGLNQGVCFNLSATTGITNYGVGRNGNGGTAWDSIISGSNENFTTPNQYATDTGLDFAYLFVDVYLNLTTGYCNYLYSAAPTGPGSTGFVQRRKTALATAGGDAVGIIINGSTSSMDIAELVVWKDEPNW